MLVAEKVHRISALQPLKEDLQQAVLLRLMESATDYDPCRGSRIAFAQRVICCTLDNFLRHRFAKMRDPRRTRSLDRNLKCKSKFADSLGEDQHAVRLGNWTRCSSERTELHWDVSEVLKTLPPDLQMVARLMMDRPQTVAAAELEMARSTLQVRLKQLRAEFENAGLGDYLFSKI